MKKNSRSQLKFFAGEPSWLSTILGSLEIQRGPGWPDEFGRKISNHISGVKKKPIYALSLFTGCGGLDIGFHDAGFDIVEMVELENRFVDSLHKNVGAQGYLGRANPVCIDVRKYKPSFSHKIDLIIGGPPCQTFSAAGRRASGVKGTTDPRGNLFKEYVRILKELKPKAFLFENVYGIVGAQGGSAWKAIQKSFKAAGYDLHFRILDAADYGTPQHRERLIIVGVKKGQRAFRFPRPITGPDSPGEESYYSAGESIRGLTTGDSVDSFGGRYGHLLKNIPPGLNYSFYTAELGYPSPVFGWRSKFSDFLYKADPEKPVRAIKAQGGKYTGPFSWEGRPFSVSELKRLQTIPDAYELVGARNACIHQIGNSVPPQFARMLGLSILDQVFGIDTPFPMRYLEECERLGFRHRKRELTDEYREKAKSQIKDKQITNGLNHDHQEEGRVMARLMGNLSLKIATPEGLDNEIDFCKVNYSLSSDAWVFSSLGQRGDAKVTIKLKPRPGASWNLPTREVSILTDEEDERRLTLLWKFLEKKVKEVSGYADLVQLSGYYQYKPQLEIEAQIEETEVNTLWSLLKRVLSGQLVAREIHLKELASIFRIGEKEVRHSLYSLKAAGYEIRNTNTNPQIKEGHYLIPYAFPTLNPNSVQLNKSL